MYFFCSIFPLIYQTEILNRVTHFAVMAAHYVKSLFVYNSRSTFTLFLVFKMFIIIAINVYRYFMFPLTQCDYLFNFIIRVLETKVNVKLLHMTSTFMR
jgi:hypothetical protein